MKDLIVRLASMKFGVALLVVILIALAAGTILESSKGTETALALVYHALWFRILLFVLAVNIACSLAAHWPWGRRRIGFAMTHGSMLIILIGAMTTDLVKVEGRLALWEGEQSDSIATPPAGGAAATHRMPFSVHLDSFEIDYYQGTSSPAMFRSRVQVTDTATGRTFPAIIEMNHELSYAGYRLFQSSYEQTPQRDKTILAVSRDPGQPIVFLGYTILMLGMMTVLMTRIVQRREAQALAGGTLVDASAKRAAALLAGVATAALLTGTPGTFAATLPDAGTTESLRRLPVQHDGRIMPLDTVAREATWRVTGRGTWNGTDPVTLVLGWAFDPEGWAAEPLIPAGRALVLAAGLPADRDRFSFLEFVNNPRVMGLLREARAGQPAGPSAPALREAQKLEQRLILMEEFLRKTIFRAIPDSRGGSTQWAHPPHLRDTAGLMAVHSAAPGAPFAPDSKIDLELQYNRVRPSRLSWWILLSSTAISLLGWRQKRRFLSFAGAAGLALGFAVMTWGLGARWGIAGRIPASNIYESLLFLAWGVALCGILVFVGLRSRMVVLNASALAGLTMLLADCLPIDRFIHPMPPVLSGTPWLAIHVPIIMVSYSLLALAMVAAHVQISLLAFAPSRRETAAKAGEVLYWYMHVGSFLLIVGILTGSIWAASSWGRYWGWDPKEVWSLVAFIAYLAILHGRFDKLLGPFGIAAFSIVAFWTILMTYLGVNFVLGAGLHAYGTAGSDVVKWMSIVAGAEVVFLGVALMVHRNGAARINERPATA